MLQFNYKKKEYHVIITDVMAFPQDYAAIMLQHREIRSYPKVVGVDIGGFTTDYLMFRSGIEDMEICDSMETGIISLYNRITARMRADYDVLLEEADIDSIIQGKKGFYEEKVVRAVLQEANQCGFTSGLRKEENNNITILIMSNILGSRNSESREHILHIKQQRR